MSTQQANAESLRDQRILANCKKIWGHVKEFEIDIDYDEGPWGGDCQAMVREDRGLTFGPILTMTNVCNGSESAWKELDRMLRLWAAQVDSGKPMDRQETLDIFSKPSGENKFALVQFMDEAARRGENNMAHPLVLEAIAAGLPSDTIIELEKWLKDLIGPGVNTQPDNTKST